LPRSVPNCEIIHITYLPGTFCPSVFAVTSFRSILMYSPDLKMILSTGRGKGGKVL